MTTKTAKTALKTENAISGTDIQPPAQNDAEKRGTFFVKEASTFPIPSKEIVLREARTQLVELSEVLLLERDPSTVVAKRRPHQIDPSRDEACSPIMPCIRRLRETGNPYPADVSDPVIVTADQYRPLSAVSYHTFEALMANGEVYSADSDTIEAILAAAGVPSCYDSRMAAIDTLRDLALFGLGQQFRVGRARLFRPVAVEATQKAA